MTYWLLREFTKDGKQFISWHSYKSEEVMNYWAEIYAERGDKISIQRDKTVVRIPGKNFAGLKHRIA